MIDKKVLILTAAMAPMLNCFDTNALGGAQQNGDANVAHMQLNRFVRVHGVIYSNYDPAFKTILINGEKYNLDDPVPLAATNDRSQCRKFFENTQSPYIPDGIVYYPGVTLGSYLRHSCDACENSRGGLTSENAIHLGLYDGKLDELVPDDCWLMIDRTRPIHGLTWRQYLAINEYSLSNIGAMSLLELFPKDFLKTNLPIAVVEKLNGAGTWMDYFIYHCRNGNTISNLVNELKADGFLKQPLPSLLTNIYPQYASLTREDFFRFEMPREAAWLNLYSENVLNAEVPESVLLANELPAGSNMLDYLSKCCHHVAQRYHHGYTNLRINNDELEFHDYMRFYETDKAIALGFFSADILGIQLPHSITDHNPNARWIFEHNNLMTWNDYKELTPTHRAFMIQKNWTDGYLKM